MFCFKWQINPYNMQVQNDNNKKVGIVVDFSKESICAVKWAVSHYIRPHDIVFLIHVQPTHTLYGADWGDKSMNDAKKNKNLMNGKRKFKFTKTLKDLNVSKGLEKGQTLGHILKSSQRGQLLIKPLEKANINYIVHIVKDHDLKERICLEAKRLKVDALIIGSTRSTFQDHSSSLSLSSIVNYCVHHCDCPVLVVQCQVDGTLEKDTLPTSYVESKL